MGSAAHRKRELQALQNQLAGIAGQPWLASRSWLTGCTCSRAIHQAAFTRPSSPRLASRTGQARGAAIKLDLDALCRKIRGQYQVHATTGRAILTVTAIVAISPPACLTPGTAARFAIGAVKPDETRRTGPTAGIDCQQRRLHGLQ